MMIIHFLNFKKKLSLKAHESGIAFLKLNNDGSKLATASIRGNIIRIFDTINGKIIQELKRGNGDSNIYSINFSYDNNFIGLTSDHGTAHIFLLNKNIKEINNVLARSSQIFDVLCSKCKKRCLEISQIVQKAVILRVENYKSEKI